MYKSVQEIFLRAMRKNLTFKRAENTIKRSKLKSLAYLILFLCLFCCVGSKFWHSELLLHHAGSFVVGQKLKFW